MTTPINDGGPAFPCPDDYAQDGRPLYGPRNIQGMSLRDWFAGQALAGIAAPGCGYETDRIAERAYNLADAMLGERQKGKQ
jgi:hypothetical protein